MVLLSWSAALIHSGIYVISSAHWWVLMCKGNLVTRPCWLCKLGMPFACSQNWQPHFANADCFSFLPNNSLLVLCRMKAQFLSRNKGSCEWRNFHCLLSITVAHQPDTGTFCLFILLRLCTCQPLGIPSASKWCSFGGPRCMHMCSDLFYICEHDSLYAACSPGSLPCGLCMRIRMIAP